MKINTALVLCAGFGRRLNPITIKTPKPLLKIKEITLLERCINLVKDLKIQKILINSFYLKDQIDNFIKNNDYDIAIEVIEDGDEILDTGGGILNLISNSNEKNFLVLNPDTIWNKNYNNEIKKMIDLYFEKKLSNILLLVKKDLSFDENLSGDFNLENNLINFDNKSFIYTGCQILNSSILKSQKISNFSMNKIWKDLIEKKLLNGFESNLKFFHVSNLEIFKKLQDL